MTQPTPGRVRSYDDEVIRVVCSAGRTGWDGVSEAVMAHGEVVRRKAGRFLDALAVAGYEITPERAALKDRIDAVLALPMHAYGTGWHSAMKEVRALLDPETAPASTLVSDHPGEAPDDCD